MIFTILYQKRCRHLTTVNRQMLLACPFDCHYKYARVFLRRGRQHQPVRDVPWTFRVTHGRTTPSVDAAHRQRIDNDTQRSAARTARHRSYFSFSTSHVIIPTVECAKKVGVHWLTAFRQKLKTHLFRQSYPDIVLELRRHSGP